MKQNQVQQKEIRLGTHGEHYGSWMSNPVFYVIGALLALSVVLAVLSFAVFHITALGVVFVIAAVILLALLLWCAWIRRQYAFGGGGMMDRTHLVVLSHLDFDGQGQLLEVGCGSGPLSIRAALMWPEAKVTGIDYWGADFGYNQTMCEKNAASEGVAARCVFKHGDANKLDFPDKSFDAVVSNYVYHNIMGSDKRALLLETLRVLLILSEDDTTFTPACREDLIALMPSPTVVTDLTGGHLALMVRLEQYADLRRDLSRSVFAKQCAIRIDKQQKERYNNIVIDNDVII